MIDWRKVGRIFLDTAYWLYTQSTRSQYELELTERHASTRETVQLKQSSQNVSFPRFRTNPVFFL